VAIAFRDIRKVFADGTVALDAFDLSFDAGEFIVLLGPSGSGKSTACRILAGLERPSSGAVEIDGHDITGLPPRERNASMVFQSYALYPHKNVYENIAYPLRIRKRAGRDIDEAVRHMAGMLQIGELLGRRPRQLSGGEAQRVAVARALVWQPDICLMDEPLSNLDALLRLKTRAELKRIHRELQKTFVFVTHDQEEAMSLGTRIAVLARGRLIQFDAPAAIYHRPATRFVAEFIGRPAMNTIDGAVSGGVFRSGELAVPVDCGDGPVVLGVRPEDIRVCAGPEPDSVAMTLDVVEAVEPDVLLSLQLGALTLSVRLVRRGAEFSPGDILHLVLPRESHHFFDADSGRRRPAGDRA
jgi:sn-glycerol 3-phosphate transport system ATP-binding protein